MISKILSIVGIILVIGLIIGAFIIVIISLVNSPENDNNPDEYK